MLHIHDKNSKKIWIRCWLLSFCAAALITPTPGQAIDSQGLFVAGGSAGGETCPDFVRARSMMHSARTGSLPYVQELSGYVTFLEGYRTAYNQVSSDTYDIFYGLTDEQMLAWIENWCRNNPLERFSSAVIALAAQRLPYRRRTG